MTRVVLTQLPGLGQVARLDDDAAHHLMRVLRLRMGAELVIADGQGRQAAAALARTGPEGTYVEQVAEAVQVRVPGPVHLLLGLLKGPAMDDAVRMATEAGMTHLHPLLVARSVPTDGRPDRWARIVQSAAEQCGRPELPVLHAPSCLRDALARLGDVADRRVATPGAPRPTPAMGAVAVAVGPEGGFAPPELAQLADAGFAPMGLGPWVLRAATAAPVAVGAVVPH